MYHFFYFVPQNLQTSFSRMADHSYNVANHAAISQKEAIESPEMERFWLIKHQTNKGGKIVVTCFENAMSYVFLLHLLRQLLPTSQPSEDARLARRQHYKAV